MVQRQPKRWGAIVAAVVATALAMVVLDLAWLGVIARGLYDSSLAPLKRADVYLPAAALFYAFYIASIVHHAVLPAASAKQAFGRGAAMGLFAYATYDLTNWAVLRDWPALIVPVDILWGIGLTGVAAMAGRWAYGRLAGVER